MRRIIILAACFICVGCDVKFRHKGEHFFYWVNNYSEHDVWVAEGDYYYQSWSGIWSNKELYQVEKNSRKKYFLYLEKSFESYFGYNTFYTIYFYRGSALDSGEYGWPKDGECIARYHLTLDDLISLNWTLSYPPDERMQCVSMSPPYDNYPSHPVVSE